MCDNLFCMKDYLETPTQRKTHWRHNNRIPGPTHRHDSLLEVIQKPVQSIKIIPFIIFSDSAQIHTTGKMLGIIMNNQPFQFPDRNLFDRIPQNSHRIGIKRVRFAVKFYQCGIVSDIPTRHFVGIIRRQCPFFLVEPYDTLRS